MTAVYRLRLKRTLTQATDFEVLAATPDEAEAKARKSLPHVREWISETAGEPETEFVREVIPG